MQIKLAALADIPSICSLYREFWRYNADLQPEYYQEATESGEYPKSVISSETSGIFLAEKNSGIVGMIHVRESQTLDVEPVVRHKFAEVVELIVTAPHRRKGAGALLMNAAAEWGRARGLDYIELFVLSDAVGEKHFYEQYGFDTVSQNMRYKLKGKCDF